MSKRLIVGNWKMNLDVRQSLELLGRIEASAADSLGAAEVVVCPGVISLAVVAGAAGPVKVGVQNLYFADAGAFTGEVSATQVAELADYAIVGHSERRQFFGESDEMVARKVAACVRNHISPIICIGETKHERDQGETMQVLHDQLASGLTMLTGAEIKDCVIAYEPVWAIGTGDQALPEQVETALKTIRTTLKELFGKATAQTVRLLYGGSVSAATAPGYLGLAEVAGLLVGGASLSEHEFSGIIKAAADGKN